MKDRPDATISLGIAALLAAIILVVLRYRDESNLPEQDQLGENSTQVDTGSRSGYREPNIDHETRRAKRGNRPSSARLRFERERQRLEQQLSGLEEAGLGQRHPTMIELASQLEWLGKQADGELTTGELANLRARGMTGILVDPASQSRPSSARLLLGESQRLEQLRAELEEAGVGHRHPTMIALGNQLDFLERQADGEITTDGLATPVE